MYDTHTVPDSVNETGTNGIVLRQTPKRLSALMGWTWIGLAFSIFFGRLGGWLLLISAMAVFGIFIYGLQILAPYLGILLRYSLLPMLEILVVYIVAYCAASQVENQRLTISDLFGAFLCKTKDLLLLFVLQTICLSAIASLLGIIGVPLALLLVPVMTELFPLIGLEVLSNSEAGLYIAFAIIVILMAFSVNFLNAFIIPAIIGLPVCLVLRQPVPPLNAIGMGISAAFSNIKPMMLYAVTTFILTILIILLLGSIHVFLASSATLSLKDVSTNFIITYFVQISLLLSIFHGVISYIVYLTTWTDAEWEF